jgi:hypothetical protein
MGKRYQVKGLKAHLSNISTPGFNFLEVKDYIGSILEGLEYIIFPKHI